MVLMVYFFRSWQSNTKNNSLCIFANEEWFRADLRGLAILSLLFLLYINAIISSIIYSLTLQKLVFFPGHYTWSGLN